MKCNYKSLSNSDIEAMIRKRMDELYALRQELDRRKGNIPEGPGTDFTKCLTD